MDFNRVVAGEGSEAYFLRGKDSTPEKLKEPSASLPGHTERTAEFLLPATNKAYSESVLPQFHKLKEVPTLSFSTLPASHKLERLRSVYFFFWVSVNEKALLANERI